MTGTVNIDYRDMIYHLMHDTLADEAAWHDWLYREIRPLGMPPRPWHQHEGIEGDCSKGAQYLWWWVKGPDPMGRNFDGYGNSSTMALHLPHLAGPAHMKVGDIGTIGWNGDLHAAVCLEPGDDPLMWSFGHPGTPNTYRLSWDNRWPKQYLLVDVPVYHPTADDLLRLKTGYWSWMQWDLGRGAWRHKKAHDILVRPDVPRVIPDLWWKKRDIFIKNELKGNPHQIATPRGV